MSTPFTEVIDLALISFKDYKLDRLYSISETDFTNYLTGFVIKSIPKFYECKKDLEDIDLENGLFNEDLTLTEKVILSDLTVIEWMSSKILDVTQMQNQLNDTDFKMYSQAQNLKSKIDAQNILIERVNQNMTVYGFKNAPWTDWAGGVFE